MKINLKHITVFAGLALAAGCGGDDDKNKDDLSTGDLSAAMHDMAHSTDGPGPTCATTYDASGTLVTIGLQAISPEVAWSGGYPFTSGVLASWYDECNAPTATSGDATPGTGFANFTLTQNANVTARPSIVDPNYLPSVSDPLPAGTSDQPNAAIPDHLWQKASVAATSNGPAITAVTTLVPSTTQAQLLDQGVCIFEALKSHTSSGPVAEPATLTISAADTAAGFHIYSIHGTDTKENTSGITLKDDNNGGASGRFLITSPTNKTVTSITVQPTAISGTDTFTSFQCAVIPGQVVFEPVVCTGCPSS